MIFVADPILFSKRTIKPDSFINEFGTLNEAIKRDVMYVAQQVQDDGSLSPLVWSEAEEQYLHLLSDSTIQNKQDGKIVGRMIGKFLCLSARALADRIADIQVPIATIIAANHGRKQKHGIERSIDIRTENVRGNVTVSNVSPPSYSPRYDLLGVHFGEACGYEMIWRPSPARVVHHTKNKIFDLNHDELIMVPEKKAHVIAISFNDSGFSQEAYVNVNLPPEVTKLGWMWQDLELDVKLFVTENKGIIPAVLDYDEFLEANLTDDLRSLALRETERVIDDVLKARSPYDMVGQPWMGLSSLEKLRCNISANDVYPEIK